MTRRSILLTLVSAGLLGFDTAALTAQERIRLDGWVQWLGGNTLQVMTGGGTVAVDLRQADQGSYRGLRTGDRVIVDGVVATDRRSVVAYGIWRGPTAVEAP
jgi:hypothetical protein